MWGAENPEHGGHACPNPACAYFAVTDAGLHAVVGNGKRGKGKDIQDWQCQACQKKFTSRLYTPLYRLKTDPEKVIWGLRLLAKGCALSGLVRCTPPAEVPGTRWHGWARTACTGVFARS